MQLYRVYQKKSLQLKNIRETNERAKLAKLSVSPISLTRSGTSSTKIILNYIVL